jgi:hypothetical protein
MAVLTKATPDRSASKCLSEYQDCQASPHFLILRVEIYPAGLPACNRHDRGEEEFDFKIGCRGRGH